MQAFLDSQLLGKAANGEGNKRDHVTEEERSCLSSVADDQSYQVVQHLINKLGESREKEESIRKDFALFQKWMKKISIDELVRDMEGIMSENSRLIAELKSSSAANQDMDEQVERLKAENYDLKLKLLASEEYGGGADGHSKAKALPERGRADHPTDSTHSSSSQSSSSDESDDDDEDDARSRYSRVGRSARGRRRERSRRRNSRSREASLGEIKDLQLMLEEAVEEKHSMKRQMNKLQQELSLKCIAVEESRSLRSELDSLKRELKTLKKSRDDVAKKEAKALSQIQKLEAMLDEAIDEFDNLEALYDKKSKEFESLSEQHKSLKKSGVGALCCLDGGTCKNEAEVSRIRREVQKQKEIERSDKESVELLLGEMGAEVDTMRDFAQAAITEKLLLERNVKQLNEILSRCNCTSGSLRNLFKPQPVQTEGNRTALTGMNASIRSHDMDNLRQLHDEGPLIAQAHEVLTSVIDTMQDESCSVGGGQDKLAKRQRGKKSRGPSMPSTLDFFDLDQKLSGRKPRTSRPTLTQSLTIQKESAMLDSSSSLPGSPRRHSLEK